MSRRTDSSERQRVGVLTALFAVGFLLLIAALWRLQILEACLQPLTVVIIGCFVLLLALAVFQSLTQIMLYLGT